MTGGRTIGGRRSHGGAGGVETLSEGVDRELTAVAKGGMGQAAAAEVIEDGAPTQVEDTRPGHDVFSLTGLSASSGK